MVVKSEFQIDLFQLKHAPNTTQLVEAYMRQAANKLGEELVNKFPYTRMPFEGELPTAVLTKDHHFVDRYSLELVVLNASVIRQLIREFESDAEKLIQERDNESDANILLGKAELFKALLI